MKKSLILVSAACAAAACLCACNSSCNNNNSENGYDAINSMLKQNYSSIVITVTDTFDDDTSLVGEYTLNYSDGGVTVSYSVERFADISLENPSTDFKTTITGETVIKDGEVVSGNADIVASIPVTGFDFKEEYFENAELKSVYFKADVKEPKAFTGTQTDCSGMTVYATFIDVIHDIELTYTSSDGVFVKCTYRFKK